MDRNKLKWTKIDQNTILMWLNKSITIINTMFNYLSFKIVYKGSDIDFNYIKITSQKIEATTCLEINLYPNCLLPSCLLKILIMPKRHVMVLNLRISLSFKLKSLKKIHIHLIIYIPYIKLLCSNRDELFN